MVKRGGSIDDVMPSYLDEFIKYDCVLLTHVGPE